MGYIRSHHIRAFVEGQTISRIYEETPEKIRIKFTNGESLHLNFAWKEIIATPYRADGSVKQSTEIDYAHIREDET